MLSDDSDDSDISLSKKSAISAVDISESPPRNEPILPNFDLLLLKFHFILPNFYFVPPWGISVFRVEIPDFLGRRVTVVGTLGRASVPVKSPDTVSFDTTDARPCVPTAGYSSPLAIRFAKLSLPSASSRNSFNIFVAYKRVYDLRHG